MNTIIDYLQAALKESGDKVFWWFLKGNNVEKITYTDLITRSFDYALTYKKLGLREGDIVFIMLKHTPHLAYSFVGSLLAGCIPSILPFPSEKMDPVKFWSSHKILFEQAGGRTLVTYNENLEDIRENLAGYFDLNLITPEEINERKKIDSFPSLSPGTLAFLQYSSGTTGLKKGVMLTHKTVIEQVKAYSEALGLEKEDIIATWLPLYHDMGLIASFIVPMLCQCTIVMMSPFDWIYKTHILFEAIEKYRATFVWMPNFAYNHLCLTIDKGKEYDLSSMRAFINAAEPCKGETFRRFLDTFKSYGVTVETLQVLYGMAETVMGITQTPVGKPVQSLWIDREKMISQQLAVPGKDRDNSTEILPVGPPISGFEIKIADEERNFLPEGYIGEVAVKGPSLFTGYFKAPEITEKVMEDGYYYTGDLGFLYDNNLYITGRKKDVIIKYGNNYYAHDIEAIANEVPGIKKGRLVTFGLYDSDTASEEVIIVAETEEKNSEERKKIIRNIKDAVFNELNLSINRVHLVPLKWLIKTTSGKISREDNQKKYIKESRNSME